MHAHRATILAGAICVRTNTYGGRTATREALHRGGKHGNAVTGNRGIPQERIPLLSEQKMKRDL